MRGPSLRDVTNLHIFKSNILKHRNYQIIPRIEGMMDVYVSQKSSIFVKRDTAKKNHYEKANIRWEI